MPTDDPVILIRTGIERNRANMGNTRSDADNQTQSSSDSESSLPPLGQDPFSDIVRLSGTRAVRTIFDVGANVGQTASALSAMFPESTIYSFEPFADTPSLPFHDRCEVSGLHAIH